MDPNDHDRMTKFILSARNEGVDEATIDSYIKKQIASKAGKALNVRKQESAYDINNSRPILSAGQSDVIPSNIRMQEALPYMFGAPGQAALEGMNAIDARMSGRPEKGPSLAGAVARVGTIAAVPKVLSGIGKIPGVAQGLGKLAGMGSESMKWVLDSPTMAAVGKLWGREAPKAEAEIGAAAATGVKQALKWTNDLPAAKSDAMVAGWDAAGKKLNITPVIDKLRNAIPEASTIGSESLKAARTRLVSMADEFAEAGNEVGAATYNTILDNVSKEAFKMGGAVHGHLIEAANLLKSELVKQLGPGEANSFLALRTATANRLTALKSADRLLRANAEGVIKKAASSDKIMRMIDAMDEHAGTNIGEQVRQLALKRGLNPAEKSLAASIAGKIGRVSASALGYYALGGPGGILTYLVTGPAARNQAAKVALALSTTSIPKLATTAIVNQFTPPTEPQEEPTP